MWTDEFKRESKNAGDRARRRRVKELPALLRTQAEMLCESHKDTHRLSRAFQTVLAMMKMSTSLDNEKRASLAEVFHQSPWNEDIPPYIGRSGNLLHLEGHFDIRELAKRLVWMDVEEHLRTIGEEEDD